MSAPDMPGLEASDGHQATPAPPASENTPQGLDDTALGGPNAWAAAVAAFYGDGPTPPAIEPPTRLSGIESRLDEFGWLVRPHATGGYFCWSKTATRYCHDVRELGKFASTVKAAAREAAARAKAAAKPIAATKPTLTKSEAKNAARDLRTAMKRDFLDFLARQLARVTARRDDQQVGGAS